MTEQEERIQNGIELLDEYIPDWRSKVNLQDLDMDDCKWCVLGQLFDDYDDGLAFLSQEQDWNQDQDQWSIEHGFQRDFDPGETYSELGQAWKEALRS